MKTRGVEKKLLKVLSGMTLVLTAMSLTSCGPGLREGEFGGTMYLVQRSGSLETDVVVQIQEAMGSAYTGYSGYQGYQGYPGNQGYQGQDYQQAAEGKQPRRVVGFIRTDDGIQGRIDGDWIGDRIENAYIYLSQSGEKDKKVRLDCQATYSGVFTLKYKEGIFEGQAWPLQGSEECQNSHFSIRSDKR